MDALEGVAIRRAAAADVAGLGAVIDAAGPRGNWRHGDLVRLLGSPAHFAYLAEDEAIFGFVLAGPAASPMAESTGEIIGLYLRTSHQGFGMGRKLLVRGLSVLKRRGFETAFAWLPGDDRVRAVFQDLGFDPAAGYSRVLNAPDSSSVDEQGFQLPLDAYF